MTFERSAQGSQKYSRGVCKHSGLYMAIINPRKSFKLDTEKLDTGKALIAVTLDGHQGKRPKPADAVIRHEFVREPNGWKIDDIKGSSDGEAWSIRAMLNDSLKN